MDSHAQLVDDMIPSNCEQLASREAGNTDLERWFECPLVPSQSPLDESCCYAIVLVRDVVEPFHSSIA